MDKFPLKDEAKISQQFRRVFEEDIPFCSTLQQQVKSRSYKATQPLAKGLEDGRLFFRKALMQTMNIA